MNFKSILPATVALVLSTGVASAVPISGAASFVLNAPTGVIDVANMLPNFAFSLNAGAFTTLNLLTLTPHVSNGTHTYDFTITETIAFTSPGTGSLADAGTGTFHVQGNSIDGGSLTWADGSSGTNVTLSNGAVMNVNLSNVGFSGPAGSGTPQIVTATFTYVSGTTAVPEPASMALLGAGILGLGLVQSRKRS